MTYCVYAWINHLLPLRFVSYVIPDQESWNGFKYNCVYVLPKLVRELMKQPAPRECCRFKNAFEYYFIGKGLTIVPIEDTLFFLSEFFREDDWTFQGDDVNRPILNLSHLFIGDKNGGGQE